MDRQDLVSKAARNAAEIQINATCAAQKASEEAFRAVQTALAAKDTSIVIPSVTDEAACISSYDIRFQTRGCGLLDTDKLDFSMKLDIEDE